MTFIINGSEWQIQEVNSTHYMLLNSNNIYTLGVCDNNLKTIFINNKLSPAMQDKVVLHELTHAYCFEYGIFFDLQTEEKVCDFVANYGRDIINNADYIIKNSIRRAYNE